MQQIQKPWWADMYVEKFVKKPGQPVLNDLNNNFYVIASEQQMFDFIALVESRTRADVLREASDVVKSRIPYTDEPMELENIALSIEALGNKK